MIDFVNQYARNYVYSQNGEEGILIECTHRLNMRYGHAVEIGGNDGLFCSNTAYLITHGWSGLFVESDFSLYQQSVNNWSKRARESHDGSHLTRPVRHQCSYVDEKNINAFVGDDCDVLSLDTDGSDFKIFKALKAKPKIVIIEIDSSINPETEGVSSGFNADGGSGYVITVMLGRHKGYFLLAHTGNLIFVGNQYRELFPEIVGDGLSNSELYFNRGWLKEDAA